MLEKYVKRILQSRVYDVAHETPIHAAPLISRRIGNRVLLKREDLQPVFSFKLRGAYNKVAQLSEAQRERGVICASAGNHAQGLALAATSMNVRSVIVMPRTTPDIKVKSVRQLGGKAVLVGDSFDEALAHARKLEEKEGLTFVHPYDDPDVIAGQGTVGMEILRQQSRDLDAIFIPVGGGGLAAGIAAYVKYVRPDVKIIAVEPEDAACLKAALERKRRVTLPEVGLFADGVAVKQIGKETFRVLKDTVDEVITATTDEICAAIKDTFEDTRTVCEPAGALALAGLKKWVARTKAENKTLVAIQSGANVNFDRLRHISERAELGEQREAILAVTIPEKPGAYRNFLQVVGRRAITEFNYRYAGEHEANIFVGIQTSSGGADLAPLLEELRAAGYPVVDMTGNEMAKLHIRHMVGGHTSRQDLDEMLFRVEFPERPGALLKFLMSLGHKWNISLFHYRNHGAAYGRVLVGFQVPFGERGNLRKDLKKVPYPMVEESDNPAYRLFLN
ncbi:threonine ammonia-lyase, biosynthetic [Alloalcanivorax xenomutans]|jgi:threonine dehydratase|uniref:threonine ammonia-lyase, biosynthetic n=1 Tax=Alloalcanivorax xenomutans TaxID=1094342 RepID=UPI0003B8D3E2|nr:threonine ammonia-lyase, biosynthetic [Alloalcanivorax xenomutans]ERS10753.1 L-threonine dehydratase biosynthetic IlvA [Alcanivorax sp. PN-3]KYZ86937.1 PLP-dependent threonine dehydratase [Alcanivorax sp. KX64203]PHS70076.1 MAG: threonine ammonia-lyase, biosynthetic [Alcanivorax sp.]MCE7525077.1 threonine ammonia-lyase, biosynthetic [Alloalcanivorax xenomutans]WOA31760.1 threonine ammonia-lyase, biosynthetic [Alloalcanivorax xenomutans]